MKEPGFTNLTGVELGGVQGVQVVIGLGFTTAATATDVDVALADAVQAARCTWSDVAEIATLDSRRRHPALARLDIPLRFHSAALLASVRVSHPSAVVEQATGTASVAEAAALASSGARELLVPKRCTARVCTAVARIGGPV